MKIVRRFHTTIKSSRQVATEISQLVSGTNDEHFERSSAAPVTSNRPIRKRVNGADRRQMLESFVNRYRAMNQGNFPSPTHAKKEVGGGYYSIKKMLQEMEYNFKMTPVEKGPTKENKNQIKGDDALSPEIAMESSVSEEKLNGQLTIDQNICEDPWLESGNNFDKSTDTGNNTGTREMEYNFKMTPVEEDPSKENKKHIQDDALSPEIAMELSVSQEKPNSELTTDQNSCEDPWLESESNSEKNTDTGSNNITRDDTCSIATESDEKPEHNPRNDNFAFKDLESKVEKQPDEIRSIARDKGETDSELGEKTSLWGNLKSLANGFMKMWKK